MSRLVITGAPGSGKSTLIKHLALCLAGDKLFEGEESRVDKNTLGFWPLPYTSLVVELRGLVRTAFPKLTDIVTLEKFFHYLESEQLKPYEIADYLPHLRAQMRDGEVIIFLDGLDEVPDAEADERWDQIRKLVDLLSQQFPQCRICITSRPYAYTSDRHLDGFGQVNLTTLDADRLEELAQRLFRVVLGQEGAEQEVESFKQQLGKVPEELRGSPLFFTLMASIWLNNLKKRAEDRLPIAKGDIYRECVEMLIHRWTRKDAITGDALLDTLGLKEAQLRQVLETLAYQVHGEASAADMTDDAEFTGGRILDVVEQLRIRRVDIYGLRDALAQRAGVMYERAPNRYQFAHRSFQEHLAACYLVADGGYPSLVVECVSTQPVLWRNVMELLPDEARRQKRDLWQFVKALLPEKDAKLPTTANDRLWNRVFHAAKLMMNHLPEADDLQEVYRPRLKPILAALLNVGGLTAVDRAEMGRILGKLGDPRLGVGLRQDGLPDMDWVEIPGGSYWMGSDKAHDEQAYDDELPQHEVMLEAFQIAKYPVTNAQFAPFVAGDGYTNRDYWTAVGWEQKENENWTEPYYWQDEQWNLHNHPVVGVSWYEVYAYCRWLSIQLGYAVRLPRETEWEKAARGENKLIYPYGNEFDAAKGNTSETGISQTSAVGMFPNGASPYGILDMSGNVWEWCQTKWRDNYETAADEDVEGSSRRVLRGGSWGFEDRSARAASRSDGTPNFRDGLDRGFRVVCVRDPSL